MPKKHLTAEHLRLAEDKARTQNWKRWGPYLSERQWGTVREDYSPDGEAWFYFPHDHARSRAYRWGEDGLLGWTDRECRLCFAPALWNGQDPILKERLFGLTGPEGNHGEDVKECYYYLDSTPTHSYAKALYRYPQMEFPYSRLVKENARRGLHDREFELIDTGVFAERRYFDVEVEYAKRTPDDLLIRLTAYNRGPEPANLWLLPTFWLRNTWVWGCAHEGCTQKPRMEAVDDGLVVGSHETLGDFRIWFGPHPDRRLRGDVVHGERDQFRTAVRDAIRHALHERLVPPLRRRRRQRCGEPQPVRHKGWCCLSAKNSAWREPCRVGPDVSWR